MIETITTELIQFGVLGIMCAYFMVKDFTVNKNTVKTLVQIGKTLDKVAIVIDERIPKK